MNPRFLGFLGGLGLACSTAVTTMAQPVVTQVEPPSWWSGHTMNPIRLLVTGKQLQGARVQVQDGGGVISRIAVSPSGTHLFCDLELRKGARPGVRQLRVTTAAGTTHADFEILEPLSTTGRFQGFGPDDFVYLILPDRFANGDADNDRPSRSPSLLDRKKSRFYHGGDLRGVIQKLPYLQDLGVTALWLNPWYNNHDGLNERERYNLENKLDPVGGLPITDYHGYGAVDFYGVEEHLGDLATLRELVTEAHAHGIKIIQDQVANHVGPYHPWAADPPTPTWFHGSPSNHLENNWRTWTIPDVHATRDSRRTTLDGWFVNILPDLNQEDPECARYLIQNALWWVGVTGLDGIRQDTLPYVPRTFWRDWSAALRRQYPRINLLGEVFDGDPTRVAFYQAGTPRFDGVDSGIDSLFDFPLFYRIREVFAEGKSIQGLAEQLAKDWVYGDPSRLVTFAGLHDVERFMNVRGANLEGMRLAMTFVLTTRGIPLLYYGDEIGLPGAGDPDNRRDFPGGFSGDPRNAFEASGRTAEEAACWGAIRDLARFRKSSPALRRGRLVHLAADEKTYVYARTLPGETVVMAFNNGSSPLTVSVPVADLGLREGQVLTPVPGGPAVPVRDGTLSLSLPSRSAILLR